MTEALNDPISERATPADPWPAPPDESLPSPGGRSLPPEMGPGAVAVLEGVSFMYSDASGDVPAGSIGGLVHADTRLVSTWVLTVDGERMLPLRSGNSEHYSAVFFLTNPDLPGLAAPTRSGSGGSGSIGESTAGTDRGVVLRPGRRAGSSCGCRSGTDFADLFEIKDAVRDRSAEIVRDHAADGSGWSSPTATPASRSPPWSGRTRRRRE